MSQNTKPKLSPLPVKNLSKYEAKQVVQIDDKYSAKEFQLIAPCILKRSATVRLIVYENISASNCCRSWSNRGITP